MKTLGICLGASTLSIVEVLQGDKLDIRVICSHRHEGNPKQALTKVFKPLPLEEYDGVAVTGRKIKDSLNFSAIQEPEASEYALEYIGKTKKHFDALVSCGGETFIVYALNKEGKISTAYTGNKCASGTGEFFLQQIRRMNIDVKEAVELGKNGRPLKISERCSVFCKSDCTHALNRAEPKENVVAGLCKMVADKIIDLLQKVPKNNVIIVGGVSQNTLVMQFLKKEIRHLIVPQEATYFEALGAALWALKNTCKKPELNNIFKEDKTSFSYLPNLRDFERLATFKEIPLTRAELQEEYVLGLDVGSTTTKAVVIKLKDASMVASVYLRTLGQPVDAARNCYNYLLSQLPPDISIVGLGVTGSGRQIAGLHALTKDIINEIIAHAHAAVFFDKDVDTIFEIGGQDAKYTYLVNGVPCDYAMNEACSAGTGSFLEEACQETLGVKMEDISKLALKSECCPNFNDQCAAFVSGDIKTAIQEGFKKEDIVAGLVYSICMNYNSRVKGARRVGKKIFMQGGVCYIKAVPLAMASLMESPIIVPPYPGLMGAFGVALEVRSRIQSGMRQKRRFDLPSLAKRQVEYKKPFICPGGKENCDRKCEIAVVKLDGKAYPFGGACNKYYNLRMHLDIDTQQKDLVILRQKMLQEGYRQKEDGKKTIGINFSLLTNQLLLLYRTFFEKLGFNVVVSSKIMQDGVRQAQAAFCHPALAGHGLFLDLIQKKPDYIFLPHISEIPVKNAISTEKEHQTVCHIIQAEPYYLKSAFKHLIAPQKLISPVINFSNGYSSAEKSFLEIARHLEKSKKEARAAYGRACSVQERFEANIKEQGRRVLEHLQNNPQEIAVVLFGRFYNAFNQEVNLNIPHKVASHGVTILPFDFLPYEFSVYQGPPELFGNNLTWAIGQMILRAASFVSRHPQLFGIYITNFSCGPDSFLVNYFRQIMQDKPSLTIEVDSHTADAGVNTRIEAFLDIVHRFLYLKKTKPCTRQNVMRSFTPCRVVYTDGIPKVVVPNNKEYSFTSRRVRLLIPSMGELGTTILTANFQRLGINSTALVGLDYKTLKYGRMYSSGKECLPLILCCGSLIKYLKNHKKKDELLVYFMPTVGGNCRFSQYGVFLENLICRNRIENVAIFSLTSENGYVGFGSHFNVLLLKSIIIADIFDDIQNALKVLAKDQEYALSIFKQEWLKIIHCVRSNKLRAWERQLRSAARALKAIALKYPLREAKVVSLLGEIFVRKEDFSRQAVVDKLIRREIIPKTASVLEWLYYVDYLVKRRIISSGFDYKKKIEFLIKNSFQYFFERGIKSILAESGLYSYDLVKVDKLIDYGRNFVSPDLTGEPIIVIGAALREILDRSCGVVSIGPFNCLPSRVTEAILAKELNINTKRRICKGNWEMTKLFSDLPFLSIEVDGNSLSPIVDAKFEAFCLQVNRLHNIMQSINRGQTSKLKTN